MARAKATPGIQLVRYTRDGDGPRAWYGQANVYVKPNHADHPYVVANEFICAGLAAMLGLPVPMGALAADVAGETVWVSTLVGIKGQELAPPDSGDVVSAEPDIAAGILVFDAWVGNGDRHDSNLVFHPAIGLWIFDHEKTLGGAKTGSPEVMKSSRNFVDTSHLFRAEQLSEKHLGDWVQRVLHAPASAIARIVQSGVSHSLYSSQARDGIMEFLDYRRSRLRQLVRQWRGMHDGDTQGTREAEEGEAT